MTNSSDRGTANQGGVQPGVAATWLHELTVGICTIVHGRLHYLNREAQRLCGIGPDGPAGAARLSDLVTAEDRARVRQWELDNEGPVAAGTLDLRVADGDGATRELAYRHGPGTVAGEAAIIGALIDVTAARREQARLELAAAVFDNSLEGVIVCDDQLRICMVNPAFSAITGFSGEEAVGQTPAILRSGRHGPAFYHEMWEMLELSGHWEGEIWNRRRNGEVYPQYLGITALKDADGVARNYIGVFTDITHRKLSDRQLHRLVHYDTLTDLPNRDMFRQQLMSRIVRARIDRRRIAVIYIDIDRFKSINDSLGHSEGDTLLQLIAGRLKNTLREGDQQRPSDVVARLGGDEFVVLIDNLVEADHAALVAQKLLQRIQEPISLGGFTLHVDASLGIAVYPRDADSVDDLLRHADMAMYQAKQSGRGRYQFFTRELRDRAQRQLELRSALHDALEQREFRLVYQPQVGTFNGMIRCVEALLRWDSPQLGEVPPAEFVPLLEETGAIERVGEWVIEQAMRQCVEWKRRSRGPLRVSVNLSARQLRSSRIVEQIDAALRATGLPAACLELELTESLAMEDVGATQQALAALRRLGVRIAIDDFGTGYSSLSYLQNFQLEVLKIDRSFVSDCVEHPHDQEIIRATLALAHSMGLEVVAEGVETRAQRDFLGAQGVDLLQGYLFSAPVNADGVARLIERYNNRPTSGRLSVSAGDAAGDLAPA